ncbi:monooxygenase [Pseudonocardia sp. N23]|nr:monooxygenase [Pseudonocardia sp. N23]
MRLAEDLATVDLLSGGRLNPGVSVGPPRNLDEVREALCPGTDEDFGDERLSRLLRLVAGERASTFSGTEGFEVYSERVEPHSPGLRSRMWYGAASLGSARRAGELGMNLLTSSVVRAEGNERTGFAAIQRAQIDEFRQSHPQGRVSQGLVVVPTDSATPQQRAKYEAYAAERTPRTEKPQGPAGMLFARDIVGPSEWIAEQLHAHEAYRAVTEVVFALPFSFEPQDYVQILTDMATRLGPALGWSPTVDAV